MAAEPFLCAAWDDSPPADPLADWQFPFGDTPTGSASGGACCRGCPGVSHRSCCSSDPARVRARVQARFTQTDPRASGVKGRRWREFFNNWQRRESRQETT